MKKPNHDSKNKFTYNKRGAILSNPSYNALCSLFAKKITLGSWIKTRWAGDCIEDALPVSKSHSIEQMKDLYVRVIEFKHFTTTFPSN